MNITTTNRPHTSPAARASQCCSHLSVCWQGELVYGHYGRKADFDKLGELGVDVNQTILLIRYGKIHPSNKVS